MYFTKEQRSQIMRTFRDTTELAVYLRDELRLPATVAKSLAWQFFEQEPAVSKPEIEVFLTENVA